MNSSFAPQRNGLRPELPGCAETAVNRPRFRRWLASLALFALFALFAFVSLAPARLAAAATFLAEGYAVRVWQTDDGLPQNLVASAVQTRDGYLWFGTYSGLARFDGERFKVFDSTTPGLHDPRIECLFEDAAGVLWVGHETGAVSRYRGGQFESFSPPTGTKGEKVLALGSDEAGRLWAMRGNGAFDCLGDPRLNIPSPIAPDPPGVMAWSRSRRGQTWAAENGRAFRLADGKLAAIALRPPVHENYVLGLAASAAGGAWILCDERIRRWSEGRWAEDRGAFPWTTKSLSCGLELRDGTLAVGTIYSGLYLIFGDGRPPAHFDRGNGLPQDRVRFLHEDREGNLWVGAGSAGLVSIHPSAFTVLNPPDQWQGCPTIALAPGRDGALWVGTDGAGLYHFAAGQWTHYGEAEGLGNVYVSAVTETPAGEVWAGNFWWGGPYRLSAGHFVRPPAIDETSSPVFALLPSDDPDRVWVGNRDGLLQLGDSRADWKLRTPDLDAGVCAVVHDGQGVMWCGLAQGGIVRLAGGTVTAFRRRDGLASDSVTCLHLEDDGTLWIGTADRGLARFKDGRFSTLSVAQGLADHAICHILDDGLGHLWLSTHHGLQRLAKTELNRCADGAIRSVSGQTYDRSDGLPTVEFTGGLQGAGCRTGDGRLWFASSKGVITVDPARIRRNDLLPPVVLESFLVDGQAVPLPTAVPAVRLAPDHQRIEFQYGGLSFVAPNKVQFKYRLDGIDDAWVDAGPKRTAYYSRLPAGTYRFRVIACNEDGQWNRAGASLAFSVAPFFWQTWWFIGSGLLLAAGGVALSVRQITRRRMQRQIERMERQHELERERARIAQDIHDDVGASLSRIAMLSQPARSELAEPTRASAVLARIYATAHEVTQALDEIVWAVDPRHDTLDSLVDYMGKFAQDLLAAASLRCRLHLPVEVPAWPLTAEIRHSLFLAFKEALHNAVKHAAATEVHIAFELRPDAFVLTVADDGLGFDPTSAASTGRPGPGHGLGNLRTRLARIGGRCEIASEKGRGTRVSLIVSMPSSPSP